MDALRRTFHRLLLFEGSYTNEEVVHSIHRLVVV